jgi:hypothetical protein
MLSDSFSLPEAGTTPTLVDWLLVVCAGAGTVFVSVTVVVWPGVVTVFVAPVSLVDLVVPVVPPADSTAAFALVAAVETACCTVPDPPDPQAPTAEAISTPAMTVTAILKATSVPGACTAGLSQGCDASDTAPKCQRARRRPHHPLRMNLISHETLAGAH